MNKKIKKKINRSALWDFENARVSIPICEETIELVEKALNNNVKIKWTLKVEEEK